MAESHTPERRLVSIARAAAHLDVSTHTVRRRIADGTLTAYQVGPRLVRVDLAELDAIAVPVTPNGGSDDA